MAKQIQLTLSGITAPKIQSPFNSTSLPSRVSYEGADLSG